MSSLWSRRGVVDRGGKSCQAEVVLYMSENRSVAPEENSVACTLNIRAYYFVRLWRPCADKKHDQPVVAPNPGAGERQFGRQSPRAQITWGA